MAPKVAVMAKTKQEVTKKIAAKKASAKKTPSRTRTAKKHPDNPFDGQPDSNQGAISKFLKAKEQDLSSKSTFNEPADKRQKLEHPEVSECTSFGSDASVAQKQDPSASSNGVGAAADADPTEIENTKGNTSEGADADVPPKEIGCTNGNTSEGAAAEEDANQKQIDQTQVIIADAGVTQKEIETTKGNTADVTPKEIGCSDGNTSEGAAAEEDANQKQIDQTQVIIADAWCHSERD